MTVWQADFYRRPLRNANGKPLWELVICDAEGLFSFSRFCPQAEATAPWLTDQLKSAIAAQSVPDRVQVFRPESLTLLQTACIPLGIPVEPTRHTPALKHLLQQRAQEYRILDGYTGQDDNPLALEPPPPLPLPENLWGDRWRFAALPAADLADTFSGRMIPILELPESRLPLQLGLASTVAVPGVVIDGGRKSMQLARWIEQAQPVSLHWVQGAPSGLTLEAGLVDRWILVTTEDPDVAKAAQEFERRKQQSRGLHFLLIQPDDSGMTYTGFWLLQAIP